MILAATVQDAQVLLGSRSMRLAALHLLRLL